MKTPIKNMLYATDLSCGSVYGLRYAVKLADALDAQLHILHALEPLTEEARMTMQMFITDAETRHRAIQGRIETAKEMLQERQQSFWQDADPDIAEMRGRIASIDVIEGFAAEVILNRANEMPADMILMGSHAQGFNHTFLGDVAKRVMRRSRIPTLIIPYSET